MLDMVHVAALKGTYDSSNTCSDCKACSYHKVCQTSVGMSNMSLEQYCMQECCHTTVCCIARHVTHAPNCSHTQSQPASACHAPVMLSWLVIAIAEPWTVQWGGAVGRMSEHAQRK